jgi:hypothetical protein
MTVIVTDLVGKGSLADIVLGNGSPAAVVGVAIASSSVSVLDEASFSLARFQPAFPEKRR